MLQFDQLRISNAKLSALEAETLEKSNHLLAKAQFQLEEQEDEIKHMNELVLYAKCVSIRDSQLEEKKQIAAQRKQEEFRLDSMMEMDRIQELKTQEQKEVRRVIEQRKGAATIRMQIEERREAALMEQERRDQETKAILKQIADTVEAELIEKEEKVRAQRVLMQHVN